MSTLKRIKTLIVDDHPVVVEACAGILATANFTEYNVDIDTADDCDSAMAKIKMSANTNPFDIIFLDINLPESSDGLLVSGEDLAVQIKKILPDTKIIILTGFNENFRIQNILSTSNAIFEKENV